MPHSEGSLTVTSNVTSWMVLPVRATEAGVADDAVIERLVGAVAAEGGVPTIRICDRSVRVGSMNPVMPPLRVHVTVTSMRSSPTSTMFAPTVEQEPPGRAVPFSSRQRTTTVGVPRTLPASLAVTASTISVLFGLPGM